LPIASGAGWAGLNANPAFGHRYSYPCIWAAVLAAARAATLAVAFGLKVRRYDVLRRATTTGRGP
jgi:hypothetical protein